MSIIVGEPEDRYRASSSVGVHALCDFANRGPEYFRLRHRDRVLPDRDSADKAVGRATHALILEGDDAYRARFAVGGPVNPKTGKLYGRDTKAFAEWSEQVGMPAISAEDDACIQAMARAVRAHPLCADILRAGCPEVVIRREDHHGVPCQMRADWMVGAGTTPLDWSAIVDLKTCGDLAQFPRDVRRYGYDRQAAFYSDLYHAETGEWLPFRFVVVEKQAPHRCGVYELSQELLGRAFARNLADLDALRQCLASDVWPSGSPETVQVVDLPAWLQAEDVEAA